MGVTMADVPGLVNYLNTLGGPTVLSGFGTAVDFFGGAEFPLSFEWGERLNTHTCSNRILSLSGTWEHTLRFTACICRQRWYTML